MLSNRIQKFLNHSGTNFIIDKNKGLVTLLYPTSTHSIPIPFFSSLLEEPEEVSYYFCLNEQGLEARKADLSFLKIKPWEMWVLKEGVLLTPQLFNTHSVPNTDRISEWIYLPDSQVPTEYQVSSETLQHLSLEEIRQKFLGGNLAVCLSRDLLITLTLFEVKHSTVSLIRYPNHKFGVMWPYSLKISPEELIRMLPNVIERTRYGIITSNSIICGQLVQEVIKEFNKK